MGSTQFGILEEDLLLNSSENEKCPKKTEISPKQSHSHLECKKGSLIAFKMVAAYIFL